MTSQTFNSSKVLLERRLVEEIEEVYGSWATYVEGVAPKVAEIIQELIEKVCILYDIPLSKDFRSETKEIQYGLSRELLPLLTIRGIGRKLVLNIRSHFSNLDNVFVGARNIASELKTIREEKGFLSMLKAVMDEMGEEAFVKALAKIKYIGPKRSEKIVKFLKKYRSQSSLGSL